MTTHHRAHVAVYSLGGTIAMTPQPGGGVGPALSAAELLAAVPGLAETGIHVDVHDFRRLPGASLSFGDLLALADEIQRTVNGGVDGVVVTQGTDTIEETAYLLDLVLTKDAPVVVTGAMRSATAAGADGPANLLGALRVAASPHARGLGCLVAFADEIHTARHVRKTHASSITAFTSRPGPIGHLAEDQVRIPLRPGRRPAVTGVDPSRTPQVAVVPAVLGDDGQLLATIAEQVDGLVIAAFGVGHVPAVLGTDVSQGCRPDPRCARHAHRRRVGVDLDIRLPRLGERPARPGTYLRRHPRPVQGPDPAVATAGRRRRPGRYYGSVCPRVAGSSPLQLPTY